MKTQNKAQWRILHIGECIDAEDMMNSKMNFSKHNEIYLPDNNLGGWLPVTIGYVGDTVTSKDLLAFATKIL